MNTIEAGDRAVSLVALGAVRKGTEGTINHTDDLHGVLTITFDTGHQISSIPPHQLGLSAPSDT